MSSTFQFAKVSRPITAISSRRSRSGGIRMMTPANRSYRSRLKRLSASSSSIGWLVAVTYRTSTFLGSAPPTFVGPGNHVRARSRRSTFRWWCGCRDCGYRRCVRRGHERRGGLCVSRRSACFEWRARCMQGCASSRRGRIGWRNRRGLYYGHSRAFGRGITSGLAALGSTVGGGMVAGTAITVAAPAVATAAAGFVGHKAWKFFMD